MKKLKNRGEYQMRKLENTRSRTVRLGGEPVEIGTIYCVARNYLDHAAEMKAKAPSSPVFFAKPAVCVLGDKGVIPWPSHSELVHHEVELAALIGCDVDTPVDESEGLEAVAGLAVAIDLTARDVQSRAKKSGLPWLSAKAFRGSCPISDFTPISSAPRWDSIELVLHKDGHEAQRGRTDAMVHSLPALVAHLSRLVPLRPGDVILTGTPAGVGPVEPGQRLRASALGVATLEVSVSKEVRGGGLEPPHR